MSDSANDEVVVLSTAGEHLGTILTLTLTLTRALTLTLTLTLTPTPTPNPGTSGRRHLTLTLP